MTQIQQNLQQIQTKIEKAAALYDRDPRDVTLIAVSKRQSAPRIAAMVAAGQKHFGENKVQEAQEHWADDTGNRRAEFAAQGLKLHLIGPLQTNKVRDAVALFDMIHTVDRPKLVMALVREIQAQNRPVQCLIQVNTGGEAQKSGILPADLPDLLSVAQDGGLKIGGLMCLPPIDEPAALHFAFLKKLAARHDLPVLSMGMSGDFERAIALGATHIRIGTALFGTRTS